MSDAISEKTDDQQVQIETLRAWLYRESEICEALILFHLFHWMNTSGCWSSGSGKLSPTLFPSRRLFLWERGTLSWIISIVWQDYVKKGDVADQLWVLCWLHNFWRFQTKLVKLLCRYVALDYELVGDTEEWIWDYWDLPSIKITEETVPENVGRAVLHAAAVGQSFLTKHSQAYCIQAEIEECEMSSSGGSSTQYQQGKASASLLSESTFSKLMTWIKMWECLTVANSWPQHRFENDFCSSLQASFFPIRICCFHSLYMRGVVFLQWWLRSLTKMLQLNSE